MSLHWDHIDDEAVKTAKLLATGAVEQAESGHPGTTISLAPATYLLYSKVMNVDPADPCWIDRDRFVLLAGHSSLTQYVQLYLSGFGLEPDGIKTLHTAGFLTPGYPEYGYTKGVEITAGPLGTGIASAVGLAMNTRRVHGLLDPGTPLSESAFNRNICVIASDGCFGEGASAEASSLAGTQELGSITIVWDDSHVSIEDDTSIAPDEDVLARHGAYGQYVQRVDRLNEDDSYEGNTATLDDALDAAQVETKKPLLIALRTIISWPTPDRQNTGGIHGSKLGSETLEGLKEVLGVDLEEMFDADAAITDEVRAHAAVRAAEYHKDWDARFKAWKAVRPEQAALLECLLVGCLPEGRKAALPTSEEDKVIATRAASGQVLNATTPTLPKLQNGSADLADPNNTFLKGEPSFLPVHRSSLSFNGDEPGRSLRSGVYEFVIGATLSGIAADGFTCTYGDTFFVSSDFMRGAVCFAALMDLPVTYVWARDSIGANGDGPTRQPIKHLTSYRTVPSFVAVRPVDTAEAAASQKVILEQSHPAAIILSRQNLSNPACSGGTGLVTTEDLARGAYVLVGTEGTPDVILLTPGFKVSVALDAHETPAADDITARVVSVPCLNWLEAQGREYCDFVLPPSVRARVSAKAGIILPWYRRIDDAGRAVSVEHLGASVPDELLFKEHGIDTGHVTAAAKEPIDAARS